MRGESRGGRVLPDYNAVVFDEAHRIGDAITEHFGHEVSTRAIAALERDWNQHFVAQSGTSSPSGQRFYLHEARLRVHELHDTAATFFAHCRDKLAAGEGEGAFLHSQKGLWTNR